MARRVTRQAAFTAGLIDEELHGRSDLQRYGAALKECRNWIVIPTGGVRNRTGSKLVRETKDSSKACRLVPFVFNKDQSYILEVGESYVRFHTVGGTVLDGAVPYEVVTPWLAADVFGLDWAQLNDVLTLVRAGYRPQELKRFADDNWTVSPFSLEAPVNPPGTPIVDGSFSWDAADTTHPEAEWEWVITAVDVNNRESLPSAPLVVTDTVLYADKAKPKISWAASVGGNAADHYNIYRGRDGVRGYVGSSENLHFIDEGNVPDYSDAPPQNTDPFVVSDSAEAAGTAQEVLFSGTDAIKTQGPEAFDDKYSLTYRVTLQPGEDLTLNFKARPAGGGAWTTYATRSWSLPPKFVEAEIWWNTEVITVDGQAADSEFQIEVVSGAGAITRYKVTWTEAGTMSGDVATYPSAVCYFEQRLVLGGFDQEPSTIKTSKTGDYSNFDRSSPTRDDDSITLQLASKQLDAIRGLFPKGGILAFTAGAEWTIEGVEGGSLTPSSFDIDDHTTHGAAPLQPLGVGRAVLFVAERARRVREYIYERGTGIVSDRELSIWARSLTNDKTIIDWAYAEDPNNVVWMVRSDGAMLGLTYIREHEVWAFHWHNTDGEYESVAVVPEATEHAVYVVVKRTINGQVKRFVERMADSRVPDVESAVHVDCSITSDGRNTGAALLQLTGGSLWMAPETLTLSSDTASTFTASDVGIQYRLWIPAVYTWTSGRLKLTTARAEVAVEVTAFVDDQNVTVKAKGLIPTGLQEIETTYWGRAFKVFGNLDHLEGESVAVLADGNTHAQVTVTGGQVTLNVHAMRVAIGLPFSSDLEVLPLFIPEADRAGRLAKKTVNLVGLEVNNTRGLQVGRSLEELDDDEEGRLEEREDSDDYGTVSPRNKFAEVIPTNTWGRRITVAVRQNDPVPSTILSLLAEVEVGG